MPGDEVQHYKENPLIVLQIFQGWVNHWPNQRRFNSLQGAFVAWLEDGGFYDVRGDYSTAVGVLLTYLSLCIADPTYRRYLSHSPSQPEEFTLLQVDVPTAGEDGEVTCWEILSEPVFKKAYSVWARKHPGWREDD